MDVDPRLGPVPAGPPEDSSALWHGAVTEFRGHAARDGAPSPVDLVGTVIAVQLAVTSYEDPDALRGRLKLGREELLQRLLTSLIVGGAYRVGTAEAGPRSWASGSWSEYDEAAPLAARGGAPLFVDELESATAKRRRDGMRARLWSAVARPPVDG